MPARDGVHPRDWRVRATMETCTEGDQYRGQLCIGTLKACDDENPCTDEVCDSQTGDCVVTPNTANCDDGDPAPLRMCVPGEAASVLRTPLKRTSVTTRRRLRIVRPMRCTVVLGRGIFTDGAATSSTQEFGLKESIGAPRFTGKSSTGDFIIVPGIPKQGGEKS